MSQQIIHTIDLFFQGIPGAIAVYAIPHPDGILLIDCGPGSTTETLQTGLETQGYHLSDITHVLITHIHLDHSGAAGWLAQHGAEICVHPKGAPHLLNPEKLLASAARIYGEMMNSLWGEFIAVPENQLNILHDGQEFQVNELDFKVVDTPGHADHHFAYILNKICFSGDIGGVRLGARRHLSLPMPPPEFHLEKWRSSLTRLREVQITHIAPTHFGIAPDAEWHLNALEQVLDEAESFIEKIMPGSTSIEDLRQQIANWENRRSEQASIDDDTILAQRLANPTYMSADGIQRYWQKYRANGIS
jgi:glyoxylase-like metal-dependent hydrolase (beta-lactamase superfamily II)